MKPIAASTATSTTIPAHIQTRPHRFAWKVIHIPVMMITSKAGLEMKLDRCEKCSSFRVSGDTEERRRSDAPPEIPCAKRNAARPKRWKNFSQTYRFVSAAILAAFRAEDNSILIGRRPGNSIWRPSPSRALMDDQPARRSRPDGISRQTQGEERRGGPPARLRPPPGAPLRSLIG